MFLGWNGVCFGGCDSKGGVSLDSRSADKELKVVTPEKSKACVTTFAIKVGAKIPVAQNQKCSYFTLFIRGILLDPETCEVETGL